MRANEYPVTSQSEGEDPWKSAIFAGIARSCRPVYHSMSLAESGTERHMKDPRKSRKSSPRGARRAPATAPILGAVPKTPDVIIVEGDTALAEMLEYSVANAGRPSRTFRNGDAAIDYLLNDLPPAHAPVVLLDLDLLGSEGFLGLQKVVEARPDSRVIVLSAQGAERDQIRALRAGAIDYLVKPLSIPVLIAKVERLLADR